jgi:hypothetical protein
LISSAVALIYILAMDIKTFVSESLTQIILGIEEAQKTNANSVINPVRRLTAEKTIQDIDFDIAVTVEKETGTKGGIAVFAGAIGLGTQGQSKASDITASRIKFSIPVDFQLKSAEPKMLKTN